MRQAALLTLRLLTVCLVVFCLTISVAAQEGPDYEAWGQTANRAETAIDEDRASDEAFEELRKELADFRRQFEVAREANATRIQSLVTQIDALGPEPESGVEAEDIAAQRQDLAQQLTQLRAPVLVAEAAYNRADGLIAEIDQIIRDRQAGELLRRDPSPINPIHWPNAFRDVGRVLAEVHRETRDAWRNTVAREKLKRNLPIVLFWSGIALALLSRGRQWAEQIGNYLRSFGGRGSGVWGTIISLGRILFPLVGLYALTQALVATGMIGVRGSLVLDKVPQWGAIILGFWWLSDRIYSKLHDEALVKLSQTRRREARVHAVLLSLFIVLRDGLWELGSVEQVSAETGAIIAFDLIVLTSLTLFRLVTIFVPNEGERDSTDPRENSFIGRVGYTLTKAAFAISILSPLIAAFGYINAAEALIYPMVWTLALFGFLVVLQVFVTDLYAWVAGPGVSTADALVPILFGFLLSLASLPMLALIWGARESDLLELWVQFLKGYDIGGTRVSPVELLRFLVIFAIGYGATKVVQSALKANLLPRTKLDAGAQNAIVSGTGYVGIFLAALIAVSVAGLNLASLAIVAGALSVGIGFGLQTIVSNFVSGIILLIERPISEGDWIEVGGHQGYVRDIAVRSTRIETFDRTDVIIPNSDLVSGTVTNYTRGNTMGRVIVPVGVAYGTDTLEVEKILREVAEAHPMVLATPPPSVLFIGFGADSLDFEIRAILRDVNWVLSVRSEMNHAIAKRFAEEGIEIPFAQRDIWIRNPETLAGSSKDGTS